MKVDMRSMDWWKSAFRYTITTMIYLFVIASVFFYFSGDWSFLSSFGYYITTFTTTFFALFLRYIWSDKGEVVALFGDSDITTKEKAKKGLLKQVTDNNLVSELETFVIDVTRENKEIAYQKKLDKK